MMRQFWPVYDGGHVEHPSTLAVFAAVHRWRKSIVQYPQHPSQHVLIPDAVAQTIASWWHAPSKPYSTYLSTMGKVDRWMTLDNFGTQEQCETEDDWLALQALGAYILDKQMNAPTASRHCACHDCFDTVIGRVGDMCSDCEQEGCDSAFDGPCERPDAYGAEECCPHCPDDCDGAHEDAFCGHCADGCC